MKKLIWVKFQRSGVHCYPNAPNECSYLASLHRHLFKFKVGIQVFHNDREIEFHMFLNWLESLYQKENLFLDYQSCEMIAEDLINTIITRYPNRELEIEVSEDGECGVKVSYQPEYV